MFGRLTSWLHGKKKAEHFAEAFAFKPELPPVEKTPPAPEPPVVGTRHRMPADSAESLERPRAQVPAPVARAHSAPAPGQVALASAPSTVHQPVETLAVPWGALVEKWPEPVKQVLLAHSGAERVDFPLTVLAPALKRGKLVLPWRQVSQWVVPGSPGLSRAIVGDTLLDIPFSVVAPLFLAARAPVAQQRQLPVSEQVPDLFASAPTIAAAAPVPPQPVPVSFTPAAAPPTIVPGDVLAVPWAALVDRWPDAVKQVLAGRSAEAVHIPLSVVEPALKRGRLEVSWKEISQWTVRGSSTLAAAMPADTQLNVPMPLVAPLFFAQGKARPVQRRAAVSAEVPDLFASVLPPKAQPALAPIPAVTAPATLPLPDASPARVVPAPAPPPAPIEPPSIRSRPDEAGPAVQPGAPDAPPDWERRHPAGGALPEVQPGTPDALSLPMAMLVATVAPTGVLPHDTVAGTFSELALDCPAAASHAIAALGATHWIELPLSSLESALRSGRMVVTWRQLCDWVVPPVPALADAAASETPIEIPLRAVTSAYLRLRAQASPGSQSAEPRPGALTPASRAILLASDVEEAVVTYKPGILLGRVCALPGIQGALLASDDGLVLAARLNEGLDADTVAAFLPKLMAPALESAKALQIGEPESVVYVFAGATIIALRVDGLLLAAVGQSQEAMPIERLRAIARHARLG